MDGISCDACDAPLLVDADARYILRIEGFAAYDPLELTAEDLQRSTQEDYAQLVASLEALDAESAQDQVHRRFKFDLCPRCWQEYLKDPLRGLRRETE